MLGFLSFEISRQHSVQALGGGGGRGRWGGEGYNTIFLCTPDLVAYCFHVVYSLCPMALCRGASAVWGMSGGICVFCSCIKQAGSFRARYSQLKISLRTRSLLVPTMHASRLAHFAYPVQ